MFIYLGWVVCGENDVYCYGDKYEVSFFSRVVFIFLVDNWKGDEEYV